jgi:hypothetical protein
METFNVLAGIASIVGLLLSGLAALLAGRASTAAKDARRAVLVRSLADELEQACTLAEQLFDFVQHDRLREAALRTNELTSRLSELPPRRSPFLSLDDRNRLLTFRTQLQTVGEAILKREHRRESLDKEQVLKVMQNVVSGLREVLGGIRSQIESGDAQ